MEGRPRVRQAPMLTDLADNSVEEAERNLEKRGPVLGELTRVHYTPLFPSDESIEMSRHEPSKRPASEPVAADE